MMQLLVHQPLMHLQPDTDNRYDFDRTDGADAPYTLHTGELVVRGRSFRRCEDALSLAKSAALYLNSIVDTEETQLRTDLSLALEFSAADSAYMLSVRRLTKGYQGQVIPCELLKVSVPTEEARGLLVFAETSEAELKQARKDFAPSYVLAAVVGQIAAACVPHPHSREWYASALASHIGEVMCYDAPDSGSPQMWLWSRQRLWRAASDDDVHGMIKAALLELRNHASALTEARIFPHALQRAEQLIDLQRILDDASKRKKSQDNGGSDDAEMSQEDDDGAAEVEGSDVDRPRGEDDDGAAEAERRQAAHALCVCKLKGSQTALQMCTSTRALIEVVKGVTPWITKRNFAKSISATKAVAFRDFIQDFEAPYASHVATPLDRVTNPLPYELGCVPGEDDAEFKQLQEFVLERYLLMFSDREVALREADKDAVTFLGKCAVLGEANIRVHLGPYDEATGCWGSRCGKNLRLKMMETVFGELLDSDKPAGLLAMVMQPGKAYSMFDNIEHTHTMWVDEAQNAERNKLTGREQLQQWNTGILLKLCPASADPKFSYRCEHGREKKVSLKLQSLNVLSNCVRVPSTGVNGIRSKLEVSPYSRLGFHEQSEIEASEAAGQPAFLIDKSKLDFVQQRPDILARYFVRRAIAIDRDPRAAYPRTQQHRDATEHLFAISRRDTGQMDAEEALEELRDFVDNVLTPCDGSASSGQQAIDVALRDGDDAGARRQALQEADAGGRRCFCPPRKKGGSCHFEIAELAKRLMGHNETVYRHFVQGSTSKAKTGKLTRAVQAHLGLKTDPPRQVSNYPRGSIFGWTLCTESHAAPGSDTSGAGPSLNVQFSD